MHVQLLIQILADDDTILAETAVDPNHALNLGMQQWAQKATEAYDIVDALAQCQPDALPESSPVIALIHAAQRSVAQRAAGE